MQGVGVYVLIKPVKGKMRTTASGLEIPPELNDRFIQGKIVSASENIGKQEFGLEADQEVLYDKHAGHEIKGADNVTYRVVTCRDIAIIL